MINFFPSIWESSGVALLELRNGTWLLQTYLAHNGIGMSLSVIVVWPVKCGHADSVAYLSPASASSGPIEAFEFLGFGMGQKKKKSVKSVTGSTRQSVQFSTANKRPIIHNLLLVWSICVWVDVLECVGIQYGYWQKSILEYNKYSWPKNAILLFTDF